MIAAIYARKRAPTTDDTMARRGDGATRSWIMRRSLGGLALLLSGALAAPSGAIYDAHGQRQGYVTESHPGQFDLYDQHSRRLGYGCQGGDGRIEFFDPHSRRLLEIRPERTGPRR
jgi:hypothetical protein